MAGSMKEKYETLSAVVLRDLAKSRGIRGISRLKKDELIEVMLKQDVIDAEAKKAKAKDEEAKKADAKKAEAEKTEAKKAESEKTETKKANTSTEPKAEEKKAEAGTKSKTSNTDIDKNHEKAEKPEVKSETEAEIKKPETKKRGRKPKAEKNEKGRKKRTERQVTGKRKKGEDHPASHSKTDRIPAAHPQSGEIPLAHKKTEAVSPAHARVEPAAAGPKPETEQKAGDSKEKQAESQREVMTPSHREESRAERQAARDEKAAEEISQYRDAKAISGILEIMPEGYGFLRSDNYMPGENDVYVSPSQIRRFNMRTGDVITGKTRKNNPNDKYGALLFVDTMNGMNPDQASHRSKFEDMTPIFPNERIRLEYEGCSPAMRIVDLFSPIGKGQRGMIVSQPKAGKTTLLKEVAKSVKMSQPDMHIIVLLIDERPEEVTDMKESIEGGNVEVIYSTFDELPEHHKRVSEMTIERAKRLVEQGKDVMILLDSITRLARAYNLTVPPSGKTLSGGLDPTALHMPKRFFGAARNMREGGSLTILATALVNTGSKMDDVVYEEFKGTGNMELILDRKMSERRIFPAIDLSQSSTRRDDLLLSREERAAMDIVRRGLVNNLRRDEATEQVLNMLTHTRNNGDLVKLILRKRML
ncbi:transcription termination factor Rho [Lachnospiraceae bacterium YH-ros2226]